MSSSSENAEIASAQFIWYVSFISVYPCFNKLLIKHTITRLIGNYTQISANGIFDITWILSIIELIQVTLCHSCVAVGLLIHFANGMAGNMVKETDWHSYHLSPQPLPILGLYHWANSIYIWTRHQVFTQCLAFWCLNKPNALFGQL